ncbi:MAG: hypothetical protein LBF22_11980, partial [Deltaproteobacteria bacterium]|nr:hypothetical protein [Deltaproteobacteria bacterium]
MIYCKNCGQKNLSKNKICSSCGNPLSHQRQRQRQRRRTTLKSTDSELESKSPDSSVEYSKIKKRNFVFEELFDLPHHRDNFIKHFVPIPYAPSGKYLSCAFFLLPLTFALINSVFGFLYGIVSYFIKFQILTIIPLFIWYTATFILLYKLFLEFKFRFARLEAPLPVLAVLGLLVGYYVSWAIWAAFYAGAPMFSYIFNLSGILDVIAAATTKMNAFIWGIEAYLYFTKSFPTTQDFIQRPFAEDVNEWYRKRAPFYLVALPTDKAEVEFILNDIRAGKFEYFFSGKSIDKDDKVDSLLLNFYDAPDTEQLFIEVSRRRYSLYDIKILDQIVAGLIPKKHLSALMKLMIL